MGLGTSQGGKCHTTQADAANSWCGDYFASNSAGTVYSCSGVVSGADPLLGGSVTFKWQRRAVDSVGGVTNMQISGQQLPECETYAYDYWSPAIAAWVAALVAVLAAKSIYRQIFARESV